MSFDEIFNSCLHSPVTFVVLIFGGSSGPIYSPVGFLRLPSQDIDTVGVVPELDLRSVGGHYPRSNEPS
jgi:hypothetical protein